MNIFCVGSRCSASSDEEAAGKQVFHISIKQCSVCLYVCMCVCMCGCLYICLKALSEVKNMVSISLCSLLHRRHSTTGIRKFIIILYFNYIIFLETVGRGGSVEGSVSCAQKVTCLNPALAPTCASPSFIVALRHVNSNTML